VRFRSATAGTSGDLVPDSSRSNVVNKTSAPTKQASVGGDDQP
jgi:hypothetical protein